MPVQIFTYDPATDAGRVRLLAVDTDENNHSFSDGEISAFLALEASSVRRAAALALETQASNQALLLKVIKRLDLQTDGAQTAKALRDGATALRAQAEEDDAATGGNFATAEMVLTQFNARERIIAQALRRQGF